MIKMLQVLEANVAGARKHVLQILRGLDRSRYELCLACSLEREPGASSQVDALRGEGVRVVPVRMVRRPAPLVDLAALRALTRLMRAEGPDIVHTHASKAGFLGRLAARRAGVPAVVHTPHTFPFERRDTWLAPLYRFLERRAASWADRIVLVSPSQRQIAERAGIGPPERLVVIPNGIKMPDAPPETTRHKYRAELGLGASDLAVAFVGRLTPQKDLQTFLSVAAELARALPAIRLFLVGTTDNPRYLRRLRPRISREAWALATAFRISDFGFRISDSGPQSAIRNPQWPTWSPELPIGILGQRHDAAELVAAFDVVLLPSLYEGLPYSLLEAMAQRVAVVASEVTGNRDVIEDGRSGLLVPAGDVGGFVRATLGLLRDHGLRARIGAAARERVAAEFTEGRFLRQMADLYEGLAQR